MSALYVIDDTSDLNVQYEVFQDDGAGWQNTYSCEMMAKRSGKTMGDPLFILQIRVKIFKELKIDTHHM